MSAAPTPDEFDAALSWGSPLHDGVLSAIVVDWGRGRLRARIDGPHGEFRLAAEGLRMFAASLESPWGTRDHAMVLRAGGPEGIEPGRQRFLLELASGDRIRIEADRIEIQPR